MSRACDRLGVVVDGTSFGRYRLLGSLGEGGMGQVFRAFDTETDREVALKVLAPQVAQDATFGQRFRREAHVAARLNDPHVVPIHSYGEIDGRLYVDMRLIAGRDLGSVLEESGAMNPARTVGIIEQVADALDAAHSIDLVHRDIKPSNILLGRRDFVYLIDFGIAQDVNATRITKTGLAIGTFAYMAPERLGTGEAGRSSDIYSLACVLYECLTGQLPFPGGSMESQIAGHLSQPPPRPSTVTAGVAQAFDEVVARGMAKDPGQRYPTVIALAEAARQALDHQPRETPPNSMPTQSAPTQAAPVPAPPPQQVAPIAGPDPGPAAPPPPASFSPLVGGDPRMPDEGREHEPVQPMNFVVPGALVAIFGALRLVISIIWAAALAHTYMSQSTTRLWALVYACTWLVLAVGFALVAVRCRASARRTSVAAWVVCAGAILSTPVWVLSLATGTSGTSTAQNLLTFLTSLALIAFGLTADRPFGWSWSVPGVLAGIFSSLTHIMALSMHVNPMLGAIWFVFVLLLGIAIWRTTRLDAQPPG
jgi:serine/threonine protein kinase